MTAKGRSLFGTVTGIDGRFMVVHCPDAAPHPQIHNVDPRRANGAQVGDRVRMEYHSTSSYGLWYIVEVLRPGQGHLLREQ